MWVCMHAMVGKGMADEVLEAELVFANAIDDAKKELLKENNTSEKNQLNYAMGATVAVVIVALLLSHIITTPLENEINIKNKVIASSSGSSSPSQFIRALCISSSLPKR